MSLFELVAAHPWLFSIIYGGTLAATILVICQNLILRKRLYDRIERSIREERHKHVSTAIGTGEAFPNPDGFLTDNLQRYSPCDQNISDWGGK